MKTSNKMQEVVIQLAGKHGLDLTQPGASLRLDMPGFDRLVIERKGEKLVSVAHIYEQHGRLLPDPEIVFFTGESGWIALEISQVLGGRRVYATLSSDGQESALINAVDQASLAPTSRPIAAATTSPALS